MISEAPTKIINWLKQPRSLIANAGLIAGALVVISVPVVSAYTLTQTPEEAPKVQSSAVSEEKEVSEAPKENTAPAAAETEAADSTTPQQSSSSTPAAAPSVPVNEQPAVQQPTQYADTYPSDLKNSPMSAKLDQWGLNNRQSTSYTAWKVNEASGNMPKWGYTGKGDARFWLDNATAANISQGTAPKVHSVAVRTAGNTGFTAWVEEVNGDSVVVTAYNFDNTGEFKQMTLPASYFNGYIYF